MRGGQAGPASPPDPAARPVVAAAHPLTPGRFADLEALFAGKGCSFARGCWCMEYREAGREGAPAGVSRAEHRRERLRALAGGPVAPGLIGYAAGGEPVGWVAVGPREAFAKLRRSRIMAPVDDRPAWSVVCFVVPTPWRGRGVAAELLHRAVDHARGHGAQLVEGYPTDVQGPSQGQWLWHGTRTMFERAGFREVLRRKPGRPIMRKPVG